MDHRPVLTSTFLLTFLLFVGLAFFIRASVKDRTETVQLAWSQSMPLAVTELQQYFTQRSYQPLTNDAVVTTGDRHEFQVAGFVRPSLFLAIFLSLLAAVGLGCLALVLAIAVPAYASWFFLVLILAPAAGLFYWQQAGRVEHVQVAVQAAPQTTALVTITAHRDEVIALRRAFPLATTRDEA